MTGPRRDDLATLAALGVLAALISAVGHEAVGHGAVCRLQGGEVTLLTTTHFRCLHAGVATDAGGPLANLLLAATGIVLAQWGPPDRPALRMFGFTLAVFDTFWFSGELLRSALLGIDDAAALARRLGWPGVWKPACLGLGIAVFAIGLRGFSGLLRRLSSDGSGVDAAARRALAPYVGGAAALTLAGLCWARDPGPAGLEAFATIGLASAPILLSVRRAQRLRPCEAPTAPMAQPVVRSPLLIAASLAVLGVFCLTQGRGYGRLS